MKTIFRIPTKAQYSYIEIQGEPEELAKMDKEDLMVLLEKHNNACKLANMVDATPEEVFEAGLDEDVSQGRV